MQHAWDIPEIHRKILLGKPIEKRPLGRLRPTR